MMVNATSLADLLLEIEKFLPHVFDSVFVINCLNTSAVVIILLRSIFTTEQYRADQSRAVQYRADQKGAEQSRGLKKREKTRVKQRKIE